MIDHHQESHKSHQLTEHIIQTRAMLGPIIHLVESRSTKNPTNAARMLTLDV